MTRFAKLKNYLVGFGAVGGTAAIVAVVIENYWGWPSSLNNLKTHLVAETEHQAASFRKWDFNWDQREKLEVDSNNNNRAVSRATRNIILIRHGQYNLDGKTDAERVLTSLGVEQAKLTGLRLAELSLPYTHIVRSRMSRAIQTADLIHEALPNVPLLPEDGVLNEGAPIVPEPRSRWHPEHHYNTDGARIEAAFRKYFHRADPSQEKDSYEIIVCHANVIRYFLCRALQFPPEAWLRMSLKHASLSWIVIRPDGSVHARGIGEAGHFPPDMLTTS